MKNTTRARKWAITVQKNAPAFENLQERLSKIIGVKDKYAYILHDKDTTVNEDTGEEIKKQEHYHLLLDFKNPRGFSSIQRVLEGCHIEKTINVSAFANYLIHNGKPDKYHYDISEVTSNQIDWFKSLLQEFERETYFEDKLPYYILVEGYDNYLKLCLRFGASQLPYQTSIKLEKIVRDFSLATREEQEEIIAILERDYSPDLPF